MCSEAPLGTAPEIVREADRRDGKHGRHRGADGCADERETQPTVVDCLRSAREDDLDELPSAVDEPADVPPGGTVLELQLDLVDHEPGPRSVDRHSRLDSEPHRHGKDRLARPLRQPPLSRERLASRETGARRDQRPCGALRQAESSTLLRLEPRDREIGRGFGERTHVPDEIGIAEKQRPGVELALSERQRLPFSTSFERDHARTGRGGHVCRPVAGAVVRDNDIRQRKRGAERLDRRPDPLLLVARRDENRESGAAHPRGGRGATGGRIPSTAASSRP